MRLAVFVVVCIAGTVLCNTFKTANYIAQNIFASQAANLTSVKARSRLECATVCSRKEASISFTFNKLSQFCYCSDSQFEKYLELGMRRKIDACLSNTGYHFEYKIGVCYKVEGNSLVIADEARTICASEGGHLVTITDKGKNDFFINLVSASEYSSNRRIIIDGSDIEREGIWKLSNGEIMTWNDWRPGEPFYDTRMNCVEFYRPSGLKWVMVSCTSNSKIGGYICQIDV